MLMFKNSRMLRHRQWAKRIHLLLLVSLILSLAATEGCAPRYVAVKTDPCAGWALICVSKADVLTDGTSKQILAHDKHYVATCKPKDVCGKSTSKP